MMNLVKRSAQSQLVRATDYQEVRLKPTPLWSQALVWSIIGTASLGFIYAVAAKIDEVVVATGKIQGIGDARPIMAPSPGVVANILVKEGQSVSAGQPLVKFDPEVSAKRKLTLEQQVKIERQRYEEQDRAYRAREDSLQAKTLSLRSSLQTEELIASNLEPLVREGAIQYIQILQQKNKIQQISSEIAQSQANLREVQAQKIKDQQESLKNLADLDRQLTEARKAQQYEVLKAPVSGLVFDMVPSSPGYSAAANETLVKIVPGGILEAKVFLTNRDIGFAKPGQLAQVRVDAYPFTQFGSIPARLKSVGTDSLPPDQQNPQPRFPAYVSLDRPYLEKDGIQYRVRSGQSVSVNLIVREKRVISLLTDAIQQALDSMRRIRS